MILLLTEEKLNINPTSLYTYVNNVGLHFFLFSRATNIENDEANNVKNQLTGQYGAVPEVARQYKVSLLYVCFI